MRAGEEAGEARTGREKEESCPPFSMSGTCHLPRRGWGESGLGAMWEGAQVSYQGWEVARLPLWMLRLGMRGLPLHRLGLAARASGTGPHW